jgi:intracellular multiplication protein IcmV
MAVKDVVKVSRKTFFNPRAWLGYDTLKESTQGFLAIVRGVVRQRTFEPGEKETFNEAATRLNLAENDLKDLQLTYFSYALLFLLIALGVVGYSIWLIIHLYVSAFILSFALVALLLSQAFRFHFWYFQIKHRKLGCTLNEWLKGKLQKRGTE